MRTYNKRFLTSNIKKISEKNLEIKSGIVWSISTANKYCMIKIQGSTDQIKAWYPASWGTLPGWVKIGAPVQMRHRLGLRGSMEIFAQGQILPIDSLNPTLPTADDRIIEGCKIGSIPNEPQMMALIHTGVVRIGGSTITIDAIKMSATCNYRMGMGGRMNDVAAISTIAVAPSCVSNLRYDLFQVGADAVIDLITGTTFRNTATAATISSVTTDHVEIGRILIPYGKTQILNKDANVEWIVGKGIFLNTTWDNNDLSAIQTTAAITIKVIDQYGLDINRDQGSGWRMELEIAQGTGSVSSTEGSSTSLIGANTGTTSNSYTFTYTRLGTALDISPILTAKAISNYDIESDIMILLRDSSNNIITD